MAPCKRVDFETLIEPFSYLKESDGLPSLSGERLCAGVAIAKPVALPLFRTKDSTVLFTVSVERIFHRKIEEPPISVIGQRGASGIATPEANDPNPARWDVNFRPWICHLLAVLRIHSPVCEHCNAGETRGVEMRRRLENLNSRTQSPSLKNETVVESRDSRLPKL